MTTLAMEPARPTRRTIARHGPRPGWLRGFLATAAVIGALEVLARVLGPVSTFGTVLTLAVMYAAIVGGLGPALVAAGACLAYAGYHLADAGALRWTEPNQVRLLTLGIALPLAAVMVGVVRRRADRASDAALFRARELAASQVAVSQGFNRAVLDSLSAHIAVLDEQGTIVAVNQAWERFAEQNGAAAGAGIGVGYNYLSVCRTAQHEGVVGGSDAPAAAAAAERVATGITDVMRGRADHFSMEYPCHAPDEQRWFLLTATPLRHDAGADDSSDTGGVAGAGARSGAGSGAGERVRGVVISHADITARKQVEQRIAMLVRQIDAQRTRMKQLLSDVPGVVFETYAQSDESAGRVNSVSNSLERMMGYPVQRWLDEPEFLVSTVHPDDRERVRSELNDVLARGQGACEFRWTTGDGQLRWVEANCTAIHDADGQPIGIRGLITDIGRLKRAHDALRRRAAAIIRIARQLKRSNEELDHFAYITSHDLRAPLRGINNLSRWIEEDMGDRVTPEVHKQLELLRGRVHRMEALIDGILQYSRAGRVEVDPQDVAVGSLVRDVIDLLAPPTGMTIDVAPDLPVVHTDRLRLQQVFMNLIGNAIKHHPDPAAGLVRIGWRDRGPMFEFTVADDGAGIEPQYHDKIFVMFQTLQPRDKVEGTGVGLSLVKKIVEHRGGRIRVDSREGQGATFRFTWPKSIAKGAPAA